MLRTEQLAAPTAVTAAFAATTRAAVGIIIELNRQITDLEAELSTHFEAHPDADIYLSQPSAKRNSRLTNVSATSTVTPRYDNSGPTKPTPTGGPRGVATNSITIQNQSPGTTDPDCVPTTLRRD